jgi:hypothetical protein
MAECASGSLRRGSINCGGELRYAVGLHHLSEQGPPQWFTLPNL